MAGGQPQYTVHRLARYIPVVVMCPAASCLPAAHELIATNAVITSTVAKIILSFVAMSFPLGVRRHGCVVDEVRKKAVIPVTSCSNTQKPFHKSHLLLP